MNPKWGYLTGLAFCLFAAPGAAEVAPVASEGQPAISAPSSAEGAASVYFSREFKDPVDVQDYFPLQVGMSWTYRHTTRDLMGPKQTLIIVEWIEDVEILAHRELPEGKLILRKLAIRDIVCRAPEAAGAQDIEWCREGPSRLTRWHYLIQGNYVYRVSENEMDLDRFEWLHTGFQGSTDSRREPLPCFFFPLDMVEAWAERTRELEALEEARRFEKGLGPAPNPGNYFWHTMGREDVLVPYGRIKDAMLLRYGTLGGPSLVWFKEGIGIVRETFQSSLDFPSREMVLLDFSRPGPRSAESTAE